MKHVLLVVGLTVRRGRGLMSFIPGLLLVPLLFIFAGRAAATLPPADLWAKSFGGTTNSDAGIAVATDLAGDTYFIGSMASTSVNIGGISLGSLGGTDILVAKFDPNGTVLWATIAGGTNSDYPMALAVDRSGNVYVAGGYYSTSCSFSGILSITNNGSEDAFLAKYGPLGNIIWVRSIGGSGYDWANGVAVDGSGNVLLTGTFASSSISIGSTVLTNTGGYDVFVAKYDSAGNVLWARNPTGTSSDYGESITTDPARNVIVAGFYYSGSLTFGAQTIYNAGLTDAFVAKYDSSGNILWTRSGGGAYSDNGYSVVSDLSGNIYLGGVFTSTTAVFGSQVLTNPSQGGYNNAFLVKYDASGTALWARSGSGGTIGASTCQSVTVDPSGDVYFGGYFYGPVSFGTSSLATNGGADVFLLKYAPAGNLIYAKGIGGNYFDELGGIATDPSGNVVLTGSTASTSLSLGSTILYPSTNQTMFVAKFPSDPTFSLSKVKDVPNDQGGNVYVLWNGSPYDIPGNNLIGSYSIYRGVKSSQAQTAPMSTTKSHQPAPTVYGLADTIYWQWAGDVTPRKLGSYSYIAPTPSDSGPQGAAVSFFMVTSNDYADNILWESNIDSGYAVDNLPPGAVPSVSAQALSASEVQVSWPKDVTDPDVGYYQVYRSTVSIFTPDISNSLGIATDTALVDSTAGGASPLYYRVVTVDIHGNRSVPSPEGVANLLSTQQFSMASGWNMISLPMVVSDYTASVLYPTAISPAFTYAGSYMISPKIANGAGYWVRFGSSQSVPITGYPVQVDTITVYPGWNMVGSIGASVPVASVTSIPGGLITSQFFFYQGGYVVATTVDPGLGYWVKVNATGKLVLSATPSANPGRITIVPTSERPPLPPDGKSSAVPLQFALEQNYPNPFNPTTVINYTVPVTGLVRLAVYNVLGEEVAMLVNETQDAGARSVTFNGGNLPSGIYSYRLTVGTYSDVKKMLLIK